MSFRILVWHQAAVFLAGQSDDVVPRTVYFANDSYWNRDLHEPRHAYTGSTEMASFVRGDDLSYDGVQLCQMVLSQAHACGDG